MSFCKFLSLIVVGGLLFSYSCFTREVSAMDFWVCQSERAKGVMARSLRIHTSKTKNYCLVIYTSERKDEILAEEQWLSSCQKVLQNKKADLISKFWSCEKQALVYVFYPKKDSQTFP